MSVLPWIILEAHLQVVHELQINESWVCVNSGPDLPDTVVEIWKNKNLMEWEPSGSKPCVNMWYLYWYQILFLMCCTDLLGSLCILRNKLIYFIHNKQIKYSRLFHLIQQSVSLLFVSVGFVWFLEWTVITTLYSNNQLIFVMVNCFLCGTGWILQYYIGQHRFQRVKYNQNEKDLMT